MFEKEEDAYRAVQDVNGLFVCGKQLKVSFARPRDLGGKGCKLHVSKLPAHYTWDMVNNLFAQVFLKVLSCNSYLLNSLEILLNCAY